MSAPARIEAGRVGRPHGLDGSFYVTGARPRLLQEGLRVWLGEHSVRIVRRAGADSHPIVRLEGVCDRGAAEALRGQTLAVERSEAPTLEEGEWWAEELEGCEVIDGERPVGVVRRLLELPSCEVLEVIPVAGERESRAAGSSVKAGVAGSGGSPRRERRPRNSNLLLVPMVRDAIRGVDVAARTIDVDMSFVEGS